ncbi:MAG: TolC family protein [Prevotellaceae bacterium]|jgi:outer membrane protein TolC|nr:TolC family protein [Prevotellaceae bacterium]
MKIFKNISILIFFILSSVALSAQEMTLKQCRQMALENNKTMAVARQNKIKSDLTVKSTFTNFLPKLSASGMSYHTSSESDFALKMGRMQIFDPNMVNAFIPPQYHPFIESLSSISLPDINFNLNLNNSYVTGINLEQPIYMGGKIRSAYKMSKIGKEIADLNIKKNETEIIVETDKAYWLYVQTLELCKSAESYKKTVEEFYRVVSNAVDAGMKSRNDLLKVQVQLNQANLQLQRAKNGIKLAGMNLCQIIGLSLDSEIIPLQLFSSESFDITHIDDITSRPEYEMLNKQTEFKNQEKQMIRSDFLPSVGLRGSYNYIYGVKLNNEVLFNNGGFSAMLSVKIPLFHWGEGSKKIKIADTERTIAELQFNDFSEKMKLEMQQAINAYNEFLLEVAMTDKALLQAKENLEMSKNHYEAGMENISDYIEAQTVWQNAESEHIIAKTKLEIAKTEYLRTVGKLDYP